MIYLQAILLLLMGLFSTNCLAKPSKNLIAHTIIDGDTLIANGQKIRLLGIDTPETGWKEKNIKAECFGQEAKNYLIKRLRGKKITLNFDKQSLKKDRYGRLLAYVYHKKTLINHELIKKGFALTYQKGTFSKKETFLKSQEEAQAKKRGLWAACSVNCIRNNCSTQEVTP